MYVGKDFKGDPPLHLKIAAGLTTGALGIMVASPTDLVKVCGDGVGGRGSGGTGRNARKDLCSPSGLAAGHGHPPGHPPGWCL